jgi:hypothetical protein
MTASFELESQQFTALNGGVIEAMPQMIEIDIAKLRQPYEG